MYMYSSAKWWILNDVLNLIWRIWFWAAFDGLFFLACTKWEESPDAPQ